MTLRRRIGKLEATRPPVEWPRVIFLVAGKGEVSYAFCIGREDISRAVGEAEAAFIERTEQGR
jgi:hypothetical protein